MDDLNDHSTFDVEEINNHESYHYMWHDFDFSMLKLTREINWAAYPTIRPVCLPSNSNNDYTGVTATITGWGDTKYGSSKAHYEGSKSNSLQEVDLNVISNSACGYVSILKGLNYFLYGNV